MAELKIGMQVKLRNGASCIVKKELGRGGQGIVYLVDYNGKDYALKWYLGIPSEAFYQNMERNVKNGAPSSKFLWPEAITEHQCGSWGYLMKLRPQGYEEVSQFLLGKVKFTDVNNLLKACLQICTAFQLLHIRGLSYQDMNDGNFFINPKTGDVLICDNDNVAPNGVSITGIAGKPRYMAPEIVDKVSMPNVYTDYFSLAVILFLLIYVDRPFEGAKAMCPCMTAELEKQLNGRNAVFILDPKDDSNRPVRGVHDRVIRRWPIFPKQLREAFISTFSKDAIQDPTKRVMDRAWQNILVQVRSMFVKCPICGEYTFVNIDQASSVCFECGKSIAKPAMLKMGKYMCPLLPEQKIYQCQVSFDNDYEKVVGEVIRNPKDPNKWGLRNLSALPWTVTTSSGDVKNVDNNGVMPIMPGLKIRFTKDVTGEIV